LCIGGGSRVVRCTLHVASRNPDLRCRFLHCTLRVPRLLEALRVNRVIRVGEYGVLECDHGGVVEPTL
jgi:hypothetical protein